MGPPAWPTLEADAQTTCTFTPAINLYIIVLTIEISRSFACPIGAGKQLYKNLRSHSREFITLKGIPSKASNTTYFSPR